MSRNAFISLCFLSFCGLSVPAFAGPVGPDPMVNRPHDAKDESPRESTAPLQTMEVTEPRPEAVERDTYFYPYQRAYSLNLGPYFPQTGDGSLLIYGFLSASYLWESATSFHLETGFDMITIGEGHVWTVARWNFSQSKRFRPFITGGPGIRLISNQGLATFLSISNYYGRVSGGFELAHGGSFSSRLEVQFGMNLQGGWFVVPTLGFSVGLL